eukprot:267282_1
MLFSPMDETPIPKQLTAPNIQYTAIKLKNETLEQKYNAIKLENDEYQQHLRILQQQIEDLNSALSHYQQENKEIKCEIHHVSTIRQLSYLSKQEILENEEEIEKLADTNNEYIKLINSLRSENMIMKQQNDRLVRIIENNSKQKQILHQKKQETVNHCVRLQSENQLLRDELINIKNVQSDQNNSQNPLPLSNSPTPGISVASTPKLNVLSPNDYDNIKNYNSAFLHSISYGRTLQDGVYISNTQRSSTGKFQGINELEEELFQMTPSVDEDVEEMKYKLYRLENENVLLKKQLDKLHIFIEDNDKQNSNESDEKCIVFEEEQSLSDGNDAQEMEILFNKCDAELAHEEISCKIEKKNSNGDKMNKYQRWLERFRMGVCVYNL